jgi:hypothetical protein
MSSGDKADTMEFVGIAFVCRGAMLDERRPARLIGRHCERRYINGEVKEEPKQCLQPDRGVSL